MLDPDRFEYLRGIAQRCLIKMPGCRDALTIYWSQREFGNSRKADALLAIESAIAEHP